MPTIKVRVDWKIATNLTPEEKIVCGNEDYKVEFQFDDGWGDIKFKTGLFIFNGNLVPIVFEGNICPIPIIENTTLLAIGVKTSDGHLYTTTPAYADCLKSASDLATNKIPAPTKDVYDEIIELLNKYISGGGSIDLSDYQKKVDEGLPTNDKTIVGAIAEVKEIAETAKMVFGETEGTAYEGNKGKANADNIEKLQDALSIVNLTLEQSGLLKKYKQPITQEYNERVTADGLNVLDGSKAVLKKVVGNTVACRNLFNPDRTEQNLGALADTTPRVFEEKKYFVGLASNNYYVRDNVRNFTVNNGVYSFNSISETNTSYGVGFNFSLKAGVSYCYSAKTENTRPCVVFYDANGNYIEDTSLNPFTVPESCKTVVLLFGVDDGTKVATVENIQVEEGTTATEYQPYFTGLKSASFGGIESKNADGTETATLAFPKTETPLGTTIDFENKKITDYGVDVVLTGNETVLCYWYANEQTNGISIKGYPKSDKPFENYIDTEGAVKLRANESGKMWCGFGDEWFYWIGILDILGYTTAGTQPTTAEEKALAITKFKAWLAQRYADGNPVTIRYVSSVLQSETDFTADNEYTAYKGGTETVLENDGAEFGAENTLTQDYILVTEVG